MCIEAWPVDSVTDVVVPGRIDSKKCVHCGVCEQECPYDCVSPPMLASKES